VIRIGQRLGADRFSISNVLAHTAELKDEVLYSHSYYQVDAPFSERSPLIALPRLEFNGHTGLAVSGALSGRNVVSVAGQELHMGGCTCPFLEKRSTAVRWDGGVSPCLALLHSHVSYLDDTRRQVGGYCFGNLDESGLGAIWRSPAYAAFRERLFLYDFSPCMVCNSCEFAEGNAEDCFGNTGPTCGGCLWAHGFIQCP